ncbi:hypothetical protein AKJ16_DCAP04015 [Drosera capensis]
MDEITPRQDSNTAVERVRTKMDKIWGCCLEARETLPEGVRFHGEDLRSELPQPSRGNSIRAQSVKDSASIEAFYEKDDIILHQSSVA